MAHFNSLRRINVVAVSIIGFALLTTVSAAQSVNVQRCHQRTKRGDDGSKG